MQQRYEHVGGNAQRDHAHHRATEDAGHHGQKGQQRQRDKQCQNPWQHQQIHGVEAQSANSVDLFVGFHRADLCRKGAGRPACQQDGGEQHAKLAQEGEGNQIYGKDPRTKVGQHRGTEKGHHRAHHEGQQHHNRRGVEADLLDMRHHGGNAPLFWPEQVARQGLQNQSDEAQQLQRVLPQLVDRAADTAQQQDADVLLGDFDRHTEVAQ